MKQWIQQRLSKNLCTSPSLFFFFLASTKLKILFFLSFFLRARLSGHLWMQIFITSSNWQGCGKNFSVPLPTQLWGTTCIYMTLNYHYSSPASCHSLMQGKKNHFVSNSTLSQCLFNLPWLSWSVSPSSASSASSYAVNLITALLCLWRPVSKDCLITVKGFLLLFLSQVAPDL